MTNRLVNLYLLILIIVIAASLRLINLGSIPNGFSDDEAAFGYNAYSILKTGRDEWGKFMPITTFRSFGDYKLPVYFYLTAASIPIFGLTEFAVRFPTAIFGVFSVVATYFLVKKLFDEKIGLLAAFLLAISPFHIFVSRHALESAVPIFFNLTAVIFFLKSFKQKWTIYISAVLFAINLYIYRSTWVFVPIYLFVLLLLFKDEISKNLKNTALALGVFVVLATPMAITAFSPSGTSRLRQIGITSDFNMTGLINDVNYQRSVCQKDLPNSICRLEYNKYLAVTTKYISNYVSHFSPQLLFISGSQNGEQMLKGRGLLYFIELPFIVVAIIYLDKNLKSAPARILFPWLLIYPLASASAGFETPGRQAIAMPIFEILAAIGFFTFIGYISKLKLKVAVPAISLCLALILIFEFAKFSIDYFVIYPKTSAKEFRFGYKGLFAYFTGQENNYSQFIISNKIDQSHQYVQQLFFQKIDPKNLQKQSYFERHLDKNGWGVVTRIANYNYVESVPELSNYPPNTLIAVTKGEIASTVVPVYSTNYPDGEKIFDVYDLSKLRANESN